MDNALLWQSVLSSLEEKVSKPNIVTWFSNTSIKRNQEEEILLSVPNIFVREWLQNKFESDLISSFKQFSPKVKTIKYSIARQQPPSGKQDKKKQLAMNLDLSQPKIEFQQNRVSGLNPKYNFQNFIVGGFNQLATACANSIVKNLKLSRSNRAGELLYNPFFVYSKVGLGKTHLIEAIGNEIIGARKKKKVKYIPCPNFTSQIISAIRSQSIEKVIDEYKSFDVLIIDDIEFIAGKEKTQEVFFRVFNDLVESGGQVILSSDRPPRAIEKIEERIRSRFEGGMVVDISLPEFEERLAILEQKLEEKNIILPKEILEFIVRNIKKNIRELEGALIKSIVLFKEERSVDGVKKALKDIIEEPKKRLSPAKIIEKVCDFYGVSKKEILSKSRKKEFVFPRQVTMYLLREETNLSLPSIGVKIGNKDHTTVGYACAKLEEKSKKDGDFIKDKIGRAHV